MKRTLFCISILIFLSGSVAFGLAPIGEPTANLSQKGWWSLGIDYSMSEIDLDFEDSGATSVFPKETVEDFNFDLMLGKAGLGITDNWEVFVGLGTAKTDGFSDEQNDPWGDNTFYTQKTNYNFDTCSGYVAQIGTKYTFYEKALVKAGVACQFTWLNFSSTLNEEVFKVGQDGSNELVGTAQTDVDSDLYIIQIAPGISYEIAFGYSIYAGPLFQWVYGKAETKPSSTQLLRTASEVDIKNDSRFGGWVGLRANIDPFISLNIEYQMTGSSSTIGFNLTSKF